MTLCSGLRGIATQRRAATAVEFGFVGSMTLMVTFGTIDLGMLLWTKTALQSVAALAARCGAISSPNCSGSQGMQTYATNLGNGWTLPSMLTSSEVTVTPVTTCNSASGKFQQVAITATFWSTSLPWPFSGQSVTGTACYPTP